MQEDTDDQYTDLVTNIRGSVLSSCISISRVITHHVAPLVCLMHREDGKYNVQRYRTTSTHAAKITHYSL